MSDDNKTLLMVEDEEAILMLGSRMLESKGYTVLKASNAVAALELFEKHQHSIDAVITDYSLQQTTGKMLILELKAKGFKGPAAYLSGFESADIMTADDPASGFIQKPFTMDSLIGSVQDLLNQA